MTDNGQPKTRVKTPIGQQPGDAPIGSRKFDRILSTKAIQIGHENGITAEFICK